MIQTMVGKLNWDWESNFAGGSSRVLCLIVNDIKIPARNILEKYSGKTVKITIEVLEDKDEDVAP